MLFTISDEKCITKLQADKRRDNDKVPAVNKVLRAPIFLHLRNFETERYTQEKHQIKSFDLREICDFDFSFFVVSRFVSELRKFKKLERAIHN